MERSVKHCFDAVVMGRKTYEVGLAEGVTSPYPTLAQYVVSRTLTRSPDPEVTLWPDDPAGRVTRPKQGGGRAIWICGGGHLASTLFLAGLVDRLIVKLNPVIFGRGVPMFREAVSPRRLHLTESRSFASGHVLLHYRVTPCEEIDRARRE